MLLGQLYHWSPADRRPSIASRGLVPHSPHTTCTRSHPCIFASTDPITAWRLSAQTLLDTGRITSGGTWDLWQITPTESDEIHIPAGFGPDITECRIYNVIPPERAVHVAQRTATTTAL